MIFLPDNFLFPRLSASLSDCLYEMYCPADCTLPLNPSFQILETEILANDQGYFLIVLTQHLQWSLVKVLVGFEVDHSFIRIRLIMVLLSMV